MRFDYRTIVSATAALALSTFAAPLLANGDPAPPPPASNPPPEPKAKDILETLTASTDPAFKSLLDALKAADLTTALKAKGPFTLFAPTDDAFKKLPEGKFAEWTKPENRAALRGILNDHVVASKLLAADLAKVKRVKTLGGHTLDVKIGEDKAWLGIRDSKATKADVVADNGIIHFMDGVILVTDGGGATPASKGSSAAPAYSAEELANLKSLAEATLKAVDAPGNPGMLAKLTDLETAWDEREAALKPKDPSTWTLLDKTLDKALSALRSSRVDLAKGRAALQELVKEFEQATKPQ